MDQLSSETAHESSFSLFSHLQAWAWSLLCDTPLFRGEEVAFEQCLLQSPELETCTLLDGCCYC